MNRHRRVALATADADVRAPAAHFLAPEAPKASQERSPGHLARSAYVSSLLDRSDHGQIRAVSFRNLDEAAQCIHNLHVLHRPALGV
jgi:hypothetical protein